jgi:thiol-disulfide isomerase/thioredoxin
LMQVTRRRYTRQKRIERLFNGAGMRKRACLVLFVSTVAWAARCDPPAQIAEFVRTFPESGDKRRAAIEERLKSDPDDFWLNRLFLDGSVYERRPIREKYEPRFQEHPGLDSQYLYGRSLVGFNTKEALRVYSAILEKDPEYPWVHYSQLEIYRAEAFRDRAKLRASFDALTRVCPAWIEPYRYLTAMEDDAIAERAERLRALLEKSTDPRELKLYSTLWSAEFRVRAKEQDAERQRVAADLSRLRQFDGVQAVIANGARLIGDDALAKETTPPRPPDVQSAYEAWQESHSRPKNADPPEKKRAYAEAQLEASEKWIAMEPDRVLGYSERFVALNTLDAPAEEIAKAGDDVARVGRARGIGGDTFIERVAQTYVERGILLDRVPALVDEMLTSFDDPEAVIEIDLAPDSEMTQRNRMDLVRWHVSAITTLSESYEKLGQMDKSRSVIASIPAYLATKAVPQNTRDVNGGHNLLLFHALAHYSYWMRLATLDEHENKKDDALKDYRQALLAWDRQRDDLLAKQRRLWKDLGRSDEDWQAWVDSIPRPSWQEERKTIGPEFAPVHRVLPRVTLKDLGGNEWPADRFMQKTTIAVVWATWCGPCVEELPYVAKLAERLKDRDDVQVISFNADENAGLVGPFIEKHGYKFPVLLAKNFTEDSMPYFAIPRTWIIRNGEIVEESVGFYEKGWVDQMAARVK